MSERVSRLVLLLASSLIIGFPAPALAQKKHRLELEGIKTVASDTKMKLTFLNNGTKTAKVFWLDSKGQRQFYNLLKPGFHYVQDTFVGHPWLTTDENDNAWEVYIAKPQPEQATMLIVIQGEPKTPATVPTPARRENAPSIRLENPPTVRMLNPSATTPSVESTKDRISKVKKEILDLKASLRVAERQDEMNQASNDRIVQKRQQSIDDRDERATELLREGKYVQATLLQAIVESDRRDLYKGLAPTNSADFYQLQLSQAEKRLIDLENESKP